MQWLLLQLVHLQVIGEIEIRELVPGLGLGSLFLISGGTQVRAHHAVAPVIVKRKSVGIDEPP